MASMHKVYCVKYNDKQWWQPVDSFMLHWYNSTKVWNGAVISLDSGLLVKYQLKHPRTSQKSLQVVRLASSVLNSIPIS